MERARARIPVIVLSGFLGSGKTTLLNALLRHPSFANTAVIVNELGEIGLDHLLISSVEEDVVLLNAGCLCCGLLNTLRETLLDLHARRNQRTIPQFQRVIVETTGLADPAPILQSLLRDPGLTPVFEFDQLIVLADALLGEAELDHHAEAGKQVSLADRLAVSKTDLADGPATARMVARLRQINPLAPIMLVRGRFTEPHDVFGPTAPDDDAALRRERQGRHLAAPGDAKDQVHRHAREVRDDSFVIDRPVHWSGVAAWIDLVREFFGARMLRCKGLLAVEGVAGAVLIQGVQAVFAAPERLGGWPDADHRSRLVCISHGLDPEVLRASLQTLHAEPGTYRPATLAELMATARPASHVHLPGIA